MEALMLAQILAFLNACHQPIVSNISKEPWNARDQRSLEFNYGRCGQLYPRSNPCLKAFQKVESHTYIALCGVSK